MVFGPMGPHGETPDPHQNTARLEEYASEIRDRLSQTKGGFGALGGIVLSLVVIALIFAAILMLR
jgi:hypothetical protein